MKTLIAIGIVILVGLSGTFSFIYFFENNYTVSGMLTAISIIGISLAINMVLKSPNEENQESEKLSA